MSNQVTEGWNIYQLGDLIIGKPEYGANVKALDYDPSLPRYLRITDIDESGRLKQENKKSILMIDANKYILAEGDIIFARTGATVGKTYLYNQRDGYVAFAGYLIRFKLDKQKVSPEYIFYYTHSHEYASWIKSMSRTGAQPNINGKEYKRLPISLPSLREQQKIAAILSSIDKVIEKTEKIIEQTTKVKKGLMQQLFTRGIGHTSYKNTPIGEIPQNWELVQLGDIFQNFSEKRNENLPVLTVTQNMGVIPRDEFDMNIKYNKSSLSTYKKVEKGNFIISLRSFQGGLEISDYEGIVSPAYTVLKKQIDINEEYFKYFFKSFWFIEQLKSSTIGIRDGKQISYNDFKLIKMGLPPVEEQLEISNQLNSIDSKITVESDKLINLKRIKKGLMQKLLTGKVRVPTDDDEVTTK